MVVYSFYIFDRHTECIYSKTWLPAERSASLTPLTAPGTAPSSGGPPSQQLRRSQANSAKDDAKLIFGTVFSLRNMVRKLGGEDDAFISYRTSSYKLHYYETPSNLRFVMLTDTATLSMRNVLHQIYINLWVEYVVKNPLAPAEHKGGEGVKNELFELGLDQFVRGLM
ncbi:sybindin-like family protein [Colletotrichum falcatum]|nr:sybindin-like family protein [Colletotrichum falcatum]